jgi:hypothetical protein
METNQNDQQDAVNKIYDHAADLLVNGKKSESEVRQVLIDKGLDHEAAKVIVQNLSSQIFSAKKERANKDMLYGALWCVGGIVLTVADVGFIFWGAILFGGIQFFKGVANLNG